MSIHPSQICNSYHSIHVYDRPPAQYVALTVQPTGLATPIMQVIVIELLMTTYVLPICSHKYLVWIARRSYVGPRRRANLHVWPLQSCRELLPTASPWLLDDCTGSGRPIDIGAPLSNRPRQLGPYHMVGCQGRVVHTYWALMTNITAFKE